jgi:tetratricopeptide (TPR) repeat protein
LRGLVGAVREVGFHRLPDLALGAAAQARLSARAGEYERARRQLEAAEALDPGRPETAFAAAAVARAGNDLLGALSATARGLWLTLRADEGRLALASFALWAGYLVLVASALFVALLALVHAPDAIYSLRERLEPPLSPWVSAVLLAFVLVGPAFLPSGLCLVLLVWSALLWGFTTRSERIVLAVGWAAVATVPLLAGQLQRELALDRSPPLRAIESFAERRLHGGIFADLQVLRSALPNQPAAQELIGDAHRTLGQWDLARSAYRRVLVDEPGNIPVLLNLGAYYFRRGDYAFANAYFTRATQTATPSAAAWFNLSVGYSAAYLFDESREALTQARAIDGAAVDGWIATENPDRVLTFNGSLARREELRRALVAAWAEPEREPAAERGRVLRAAAAAGATPLLGLGLSRWIGRTRRRARSPLRLSPAVDRWLRTLLPALPAAESGAGFWAWGNLLLLAGFALLPRALDLAGDLPIAGWPGPTLLAVAALFGFALYVLVRVRGALAPEAG